MGRYELSVDVALPPDDAYRLWTDAGRWPQWQMGLLRVAEASGPATEVGTVLRLDFGPGMKRTTRVVEAHPGRSYVVEEDGMRSRNRTEAAFVPIGGEHRVSVTYDLAVELGPLSGVMERVTTGSTTKTGRRELDAFARLAERPLVIPNEGSLYTVDAFAGFRVVKVTAVDRDAVHLALLPGVVKQRPKDIIEILDTEPRLDDPLALRPLEPSLRRTASISLAGQPLLALDGGVGVPHLALTTGAFTDALPEPGGTASVFPDEAEEIAGWREAGGPVLGRDLDAEDRSVGVGQGRERVRHRKDFARRATRRSTSAGTPIGTTSRQTNSIPGRCTWTGTTPRRSASGTFRCRDRLLQRWSRRTSASPCAHPMSLEGYRMWKDGSGGFFC